ncbi:MAG: phosphoribosylamine--glycine ligase [Alphaproteobacteria bacterium]|nr:MAG: phosphoribosylamine--glycine ligase [Alphaproteobacteria bacterium]
MNILVIGGGAREHALCWAITQSPDCGKLFCAPGNYGISQIAAGANISVTDFTAITDFIKTNKIDFVVVGPEQPLVAGLADHLIKINVPVFGPSQAAAQLEGSKGFVKDLCREHNIPTAGYERVYDVPAAEKVIARMKGKVVVKADGLAAGKGVIIAENQAEAVGAAKKLLSPGPEGHPSLVIEEFLDGEEASFFALVDGETVVPLVAAQDHKRAFDGDLGPNTGGMGAYSPAPVFTPAIQQQVMEKIIRPTARAMVSRGMPFRGVLFAGLMITETGPHLIEYNVRFGDPECQAILPRLDGDWLKVLYATATGKLSTLPALKWRDICTLGVVYASQGYPEQYKKYTPIRNLDALKGLPHIQLFHAATKWNENQIVADGGRVLSIVGEGTTIAEAQKRAYDAIGKIDWPDGFYRKDIGWRAIAGKKQVA